MKNIKIRRIKRELSKISFLRRITNNIRRNSDYTYDREQVILQKANEVMLDFNLNKELVVGLVKEAELEENLYWPKYERFLKNNKINYKFIDVSKSTFMEEVETVDIVIWRTLSNPAAQFEAKSKIYFIEKILHKKCFPSYDELWFYEDKIRQHFLFELYDLPSIKTFCTFNYQEALNFINHIEYPIISKISTGSSSLGVEKITSKTEAKRFVDRVFLNGKSTYWPYLKQKDYVYFQEYIPNAKFDLRVIITGDSYFGYYREVPQGDFRASGAGKYNKSHIPLEVLDLAKKTKMKLPKTNCLAIDFIYDEKRKEYLIIETSIFIGVDTPEQLVVDGVPGRYREVDGEFKFEEGKFWIQELALAEFFSELEKES